MPDKLTPAQRHKCMTHIRGKNTKPEQIVRKYLYAHGFRYRLNYGRLPSHPDIVIRRLHTVIMVNGCFWHGHNLPKAEVNSYELLVSSECCKIPKTRTEFWAAKIARNIERDASDREKLTALGWNVITIWECQLKPAVREKTLQSLVFTLSQIELALAPKKIKKEWGETVMPVRMVADEGIR